MSEPLLSLRDVTVTYFGTPDVDAVKDVSLTVMPGEIVGLAGESGCGKTTLIQALMRLLPENGEVTAGHIRFGGRDWLAVGESELESLRWAEVSMVSQSAMNSLNPVLRVGEQIADAILAHRAMKKRDAWERARELLRLVEVDPKRVSSYPHELSGGMRQRAMIAMALALNPKLVIMDEPTTALDVVVQAQIIHKIRDLQSQLGFSVIFVTHDMSLLLSIADRIAIMYAGQLVEVGSRAEIGDAPAHPYTRGLIQSFPSVFEKVERMGIPGSPPSIRNFPTGCRFHPRCAEVMAQCAVIDPEFFAIASGHAARCHLLSGQPESNGGGAQHGS
jgi:peptide/nickel transport system ATP-binding protein